MIKGKRKRDFPTRESRKYLVSEFRLKKTLINLNIMSLITRKSYFIFFLDNYLVLYTSFHKSFFPPNRILFINNHILFVNALFLYAVFTSGFSPYHMSLPSNFKIYINLFSNIKKYYI